MPKMGLEPPKKKTRGGDTTKKVDAPSAMTTLAVQLQVDHFKKVIIWHSKCEV